MFNQHNWIGDIQKIPGKILQLPESDCFIGIFDFRSGTYRIDDRLLYFVVRFCQ